MAYIVRVPYPGGGFIFLADRRVSSLNWTYYAHLSEKFDTHFEAQVALMAVIKNPVAMAWGSAQIIEVYKDAR